MYNSDFHISATDLLIGKALLCNANMDIYWRCCIPGSLAPAKNASSSAHYKMEIKKADLYLNFSLNSLIHATLLLYSFTFKTSGQGFYRGGQDKRNMSQIKIIGRLTIICSTPCTFSLLPKNTVYMHV